MCSRVVRVRLISIVCRKPIRAQYHVYCIPQNQKHLSEVDPVTATFEFVVVVRIKTNIRDCGTCNVAEMSETQYK